MPVFQEKQEMFYAWQQSRMQNISQTPLTPKIIKNPILQEPLVSKSTSGIASYAVKQDSLK